MLAALLAAVPLLLQYREKKKIDQLTDCLTDLPHDGITVRDQSQDAVCVVEAGRRQVRNHVAVKQKVAQEHEHAPSPQWLLGVDLPNKQETNVRTQYVCK